MFKLLKLLMEKAKELEVPEGHDLSRKEWRKNGPFQILALGQLNFFKSMPLSDVNIDKPDKSFGIVKLTHKVLVPANTVAVTMELSDVTSPGCGADERVSADTLRVTESGRFFLRQTKS